MKRKLTINTLAFGNLKQRRKQYTILIFGIILAMVFSSGVPFFISCMRSSQEEVRFRRQGKQEIIVVNAQNYDFSPAVNNGEISGEIGYAHVLAYGWNEKTDETYGTMIGWLDEKATELYYPQIIVGRMPENEDEIIFEKNALQRMKIDAEIGDKIALKTLVCNGDELLSEEKEKTYTLVGIMADKKSYIEHFYDGAVGKAAFIPAAFVMTDTAIELGGKEALVAFISRYPTSGHWFVQNISNDDTIDTVTMYSTSIADAYSSIAENTTTSAFLSILLAFMACFGIVNAFSSNLKERKTQIGMLKAVGATRRQIINIFGREAFIICILTAPVSIGVSFVSVKLFAFLMGDGFIFKSDVTVLMLGAFFGIACVMLSALIPLLSISKLPPMQAIRNVELMRKMKNKKIKSQQIFNVSRLLAKRKLTFSKGRQICVCIIIACSIVISCTSMSFLLITVYDMSSLYNYDYEIRDHRSSYSSNSFINIKENFPELTENSRYEILDLPQVNDVYGVKSVNINIVFEGDVPEYLQINEYASHLGQSSRFENLKDILYSKAQQAQQETGGAFVPPNLPEVTKENIKEYMQAAENPEYTYAKKAAGFTTEELYNTNLTAQSREIMNIDKDDIIDGEINYEKLNIGEEVIIYAPEKIGFSYTINRDITTWSLSNLSDTATRTPDEKALLKDLKAEADSPFKVGDTLKLTLIYSDENGKITREDKEVKIGAILGKKSSHGTFSVYTTLEGLDKFGVKFNYNQFDVVIKEECTAETDEQMQAELAAMFPGKYVGSAFAMNEAQKREYRSIVISLISLIFVFICVSIALINNSISAQIREGKRTIGTLRAVGASEKDLVLSYVMQIANILVGGFGAGTIIYVASYRLIGLIVVGEYWPVALWPAFLIFAILALACYIDLKVKIRIVLKHSIVENIREL